MSLSAGSPVATICAARRDVSVLLPCLLHPCWRVVHRGCRTCLQVN